MMSLLPFGIFIFSMLSYASSKDNCLNYKKFFQECGEGKYVKIASRNKNCEVFYKCTHGEITADRCKPKNGDDYIFNGEENQCVKKIGGHCPPACKIKGFVEENVFWCLTPLTSADGNYGDNCMSYFQCANFAVDKNNCYKDKHGNQRYFKSIFNMATCEGTKESNSCTHNKL